LSDAKRPMLRHKYLPLFLGASVVLIAAVILERSWSTFQYSLNMRVGISALMQPPEVTIANTQLLDDRLYDRLIGAPTDSDLVVFVVVPSDPNSVLSVLKMWPSLMAAAGQPATPLELDLTVVGPHSGDLSNIALPPNVVIQRVRDAEQFTYQTGIRVVPISVIVTRSRRVLSVAAALPNSEVLADAVDRLRDASTIGVRFHKSPLSGRVAIRDLLSLKRPG